MSNKNVIRLADLPPGVQEQLRQQMANHESHAQTNARKVEAEGEVFRSKAEYLRWQTLKAMQTAGEISNLRHEQIRFYLGRNDLGQPLTWLPDFTYSIRCTDPHSDAFNAPLRDWNVVDEVKGRRFRDFGVRVALFRKLYPEYF
jgi:hypothetical protein